LEQLIDPLLLLLFIDEPTRYALMTVVIVHWYIYCVDWFDYYGELLWPIAVLLLLLDCCYIVIIIGIIIVIIVDIIIVVVIDYYYYYDC